MKFRSRLRGLSSVIFCVIICLFHCGCDEQAYTPKPKAYPRIELPEKAYQRIEDTGCPFSFEYPQYGKIAKDYQFPGEESENPCWMNIDLPYFKGRIYLSYKEVDETDAKNNFARLVEDSYKMTTKHVVKADYIDDKPIVTANGVHGLLYDVGGNAASPTQFFLTDTSKHFLRGALYFDHTPNRDSLDLVIDFLRPDIVHFLESFSWLEQ